MAYNEIDIEGVNGIGVIERMLRLRFQREDFAMRIVYALADLPPPTMDRT